jgi:hypothetical protein
LSRTAVTPPRVLFLDDNHDRAQVFLNAHPYAVWVETARDCLERLAGPWDEVHLDHDLGGEAFVDHEREDCGMEVVRWLCDEFRPHLRDCLFVVHTRNPDASCMMVMHLQVTGYRVVERPFEGLAFRPGPWERFRNWLARGR